MPTILSTFKFDYFGGSLHVVTDIFSTRDVLRIPKPSLVKVRFADWYLNDKRCNCSLK